METREGAARYLLGFHGWLVPRLDALLRANTQAAAEAAITVSAPAIQAAVSRFGEVLPFPADGLFFPTTDFVALAPGGQAVLRGQGGFPNGPEPASLVQNDFYAGPTATNRAIGFFGDSDRRVVSVNVAAANVGQLTAALGADGRVTVTATAGFSGVTYFDYVARHPTGEERSARVFVTVG